MSRATTVPVELSRTPFLGTEAVRDGLLTRRQLSGDAWRRLLPNVYLWAGLPTDHRTRCLATGLFLHGRGAVSGRDAAALWGANALVRGAPVEVTVPPETRFRAPAGLRIVRSPLPPADVGFWNGVPVTTPRRTGFDLARRLPTFEAVVCVDAMLAARLVTRAEIAATARARPGWRGRGRVAGVLLVSDAAAESPQESRLRLILIAGRLPWPVTQYEVRDRGRFVARLDLAYPEHRLGIEYDGDHHRTRSVFQRDLRRLNDLRACGWTVLRFAAADLNRDPGRIVATVRAALPARATRQIV